MCRIPTAIIGVTAIGLATLITGCDSARGPTAGSSIEQGAVPERGSNSGAPLGLFDPGARALIDEGPACTGARSPGFYCQNQTGKNPNLTVEEFAALLEIVEEETLLVDSDGVGLEIDPAIAVCNNTMQLERQIAALVLNLAANLIDDATPVNGGWTVGEALNEALLVANDPEATRQERNEIKDVLDAINNNINTVLGDECVSEEDNGGEASEGDSPPEPLPGPVGNPPPAPGPVGNPPPGPVGNPPPGPPSGPVGNPPQGPPSPSTLTICHKGKNTLTIGAAAWPAHQAHGDTMGPCVP